MNVPMNLMTMIRVECEDFAYSFPTIMKHRHIDNKDSLAMLDSFLKKVKFKKRNDGIDVRGQINYYKPGLATARVCFSNFHVLINGRLIKENEKFIDFLISMTL
jgi:vancomycin resistance protein YoaR